MDQLAYVSSVKPLPTDASFSNFRSARMKVAWLAHTGPDVLFEVSQLAQVTGFIFGANFKKEIKALNNALKYVHENPVTIAFPKLDLESLPIVGLFDVSFANNRDLSTQIRIIIFIVDESGYSIPIHFKSFKTRRVERSVLGGEPIAFGDLTDYATL